MTSTIDATREIVHSQTLPASRELLLQMWSNPENLTQWWALDGFSTTTDELEFKSGGIWRFTMHTPDGSEFRDSALFGKVSPGRFDFALGSEDDPTRFHATVEFTEVGKETRMDLRLTYPTAEARRQAVEENHAEDGLATTMRRFAACVAKAPEFKPELVIVRRFNAPITRVWEAMANAEEAQKWGAPGNMTLVREIDEPWPGGKWRETMTGPSGFHMVMEGEYLEFTPPTRLRHTHRWVAPDGTSKPTTTVSLTLHEFEGKTTMVFVQSGFWSEAARAAHLGGWSNCFHKLSVMLGSTLDECSISLEREFDAPVELVWKCWTDPAMLAKWFAPGPYTVPSCEIDLRPGGLFTLVMRSPEGHDFPMVSEITDVETNEEFGWVNSVPGPDGQPALEGGTMVYFEDLGGKTKVKVNSYAGALSEPGKFMVGGMEQGWTMTLDQLGKTISSAS